MKHLSIVLCLAGVSLTGLAIAASPDPIKTRELIGIVQSSTDLAERARALQQLALVASKEAVPVLAGLLADERLGQYARDGLEQMPDPAAGEALRAALDQQQGKTLIGVVNSLGLRREVPALGALARLATDPNSAVAVASSALLALGRIGTPEAMRVVEPALGRGPAELRAAAAEGCVLCADRLLQEGKGPAARALYDKVRRAEVPTPWRVAATRGAILASGADGLPLLIEQLRSSEPDLRDLALRTARDLRDPKVTPALIAELDKLAPPQQAALITVLVDRGDESALGAVEARAKSGETLVRLAALKALGTMGRASSLPILLQAIQSPSSVAVADTALASLSRLAAPEVNAAILQALVAAEPATQVRLIGVLGERRAENAGGELMRLARSADLERAKAAVRALGLVSSPADLPQLIALALALQDETVRSLADRAIVTTAMKVLAPERRTEAVLQAFRDANNSGTKAALLRPLGAILRTMGGNHDVFFAVRVALKDSSEAVRTAALSCLADWPDATPTMTLLEVANQKDVTPAQRETALRGAIRMATNVAAGRERSPLNVLEAFVQANRAVRSKEEKMMIVAGLGSLKRLEAVQLLQPYLEDTNVKTEAALAIVQVAPALTGPKNAAALKGVLERIAATDTDEEVRRKAARLAKGGTVPAPKGKAAQGLPPAVALAAGQLFNGKDLGNWDGDPAVWRVRDGVIVGGSMLGNPRNEFLATTKRYRNFVLRVEYKLVGTEGFVNGGVQFRSVRVKQPPNEMSGYQADIGAGHSGSLYDESRRKKFLLHAPEEQIKRLEKPGDWNRYEIRCDGTRVELTLNGERTVAYTEEDAAIEPDGLIALQIHGNCKAEIAFRNLTIEER
jgi:HEAT repeat protein